MRLFSRAFQTLPLPLFFAAVYVLWVGLRLLLALQTINQTRVVTDLVVGLVVAALSTAALGVRRRRLGGREQLIEYSRAVRSGRLPEQVDAPRWREALDRDRRATLRSRWLLPLLVLLPVAVGVTLLVLQPRDTLVAALLIAVFVAVAVAGIVTSTRQRRRLDSLSEQLQRRPFDRGSPTIP